MVHLGIRFFFLEVASKNQKNIELLPERDLILVVKIADLAQIVYMLYSMRHT